MKIFDYVDKAFPKSGSQKTVDLQTVFSDRTTCEYCQDVVRRVRKSEKSTKNPSLNKYLDLSDGIFADFDLGSVDGKPLYGSTSAGGTSEQINEDKYKLIINILSILP